MSRSFLTSVAVAAAAMVVPLGGCGSDDEPMRELAFVSSRDGDYAIYEMNADGGAESRLTHHVPKSPSPTDVFFQIEPAWSPNGTEIAFTSRRDGTFDVYVMNAEGTRTRRLTSTKEDDSHPTWSSSGQHLAFARSGDIYTVSEDGSDVRRISDPTVEESDPAWSPDGAWIAYVRRTPGTPAREVWIMRPDGSGRRALTKQNGRAFTPAWSPDSSRIVFSSNADSEIYKLFTIGVNGNRLKSVTPTAGDMFEPSWSPDGTTIAYQEDGAIFTVELGGRDVERLTDSANNDSSPVWNPRPPTPEE